MSIFDMHAAVIQDYRRYVQSFISIADPQIRSFVEAELTQGDKFWPDALIQLNPAYLDVENVDELATAGLLTPTAAEIFRTAEGKPIRLYQHQRDALEAARRKQHYLVTSGTGSGKSLTYFIPIFDALLRTNPTERKVRAIVIYPMNALVNSQYKALEEYAAGYQARTGKSMPVRFGRYTGQESQDEKSRMQAEVPHIILTNYMMLEMMLLRAKESIFVDRASTGLEFLVMDELHMYRGRQGSDIAMLARRLRERCGNPNIIHIGTSATMVSSPTATPAERREAVSTFAGRLFGAEIKPENVIEESLVPLARFGGDLTADELRKSVLAPVPDSATEFLGDPLTAWIETEIGIEQEKGGSYRRRTPQTLDTVASRLAGITGLEQDACANRLRIALLAKFPQGDADKQVFGFKVHQFISQGKPLYATVERSDREMSFDGQCYAAPAEPGGAPRPMFPIEFCRNCGQEYYRATRDDAKGKLTQWTSEYGEDDQGTAAKAGYLYLPGDAGQPWSTADLPPDLFEPNGRKLKRTYARRVPEEIYVRRDGNLSGETDAKAVKAWFQPRPFLICQSCGEYYPDSRGAEFRKLAGLTSEGRSSATTTLAVSVLANAPKAVSADTGRKLLSFTDNRQDASLQAGHFNDFVLVCLIRAALVSALDRAGELRHDNIAAETVSSLSLRLSEFARNVSVEEGSQQAKRIRNSFKELLEYRLYEDLRRGWRIVHPNLEQCGLLRIEYRGLQEACANDVIWSRIPDIASLSPIQRLAVIKPVLDFARRKLCISTQALAETELQQMRKRVNQDIGDRWCFDESEENLRAASRIFLPTGQVRGAGISFGPRSLLGRYLKRTFPDIVDHNTFVQRLSETLASQGLLTIQKDRGAEYIQIDASVLEWARGNGEMPDPDPVYTRRAAGDPYKPAKRKANEFFAGLYTERAKTLGDVAASEHTAQINYRDREAREAAFRDGKLRTLFCSPTMELGIDIGDLQLVHMRNVPPSPASYAQRSGRAGRRGQPALILAYCHGRSSHDQYYFSRRREIVSGAVRPPRIDLSNRNLIEAHVYAVWFSKVRLPISQSMTELLDLEQDSVPLKDEVRNAIQLSPAMLTACAEEVKNILARCGSDVSQAAWFNDGWVDQTLTGAHEAFDRAFDRWRQLYTAATLQLKENQRIEANAFVPAEQAAARQKIDEARRQRNLLTNTGTSLDESDFYPYRYLASEGFLPGYNFPRLPIRTYIPRGDGEFISRPRFLALSEFGPENFIYHQGSKFQIQGLSSPPGGLAARQSSVKLCQHCGYYNLAANDLCENCRVELNGASARHVTLLEMPDARSIRRSRITCDEEERIRRGYELTTHFQFDRLGNRPRTLQATVGPDPEQPMVTVTYGPSATLYRVNHGWKATSNPFRIDLNTGQVLSASEAADGRGESVRLFTRDTQNILLVSPPEEIRKDPAAMGTFQYALQRGMGIFFQVEETEIASERVGDGEDSAILYWEAAEGGAGILRRLVEEPEVFAATARIAAEVLHFNPDSGDDLADPSKCLKACYECLLSFRNQFFHSALDRHLVRDVLLPLARSSTTRRNNGRDYNAQYLYLTNLTDSRSAIERQFLDRLFETRRELPDDAQKALKDVNTVPDFYYSGPPACVYCDGSIHDKPDQKAKDEATRKRLREAGYRVVVIRYDRDLNEQLEIYKDIFGPGAVPKPDLVEVN